MLLATTPRAFEMVDRGAGEDFLPHQWICGYVLFWFRHFHLRPYHEQYRRNPQMYLLSGKEPFGNHSFLNRDRGHQENYDLVYQTSIFIWPDSEIFVLLRKWPTTRRSKTSHAALSCNSKKRCSRQEISLSGIAGGGEEGRWEFHISLNHPSRF